MFGQFLGILFLAIFVPVTGYVLLGTMIKNFRL